MLAKMLESGTISEKDLKLVLVTDDIDEANQYIQEYVIRNFHVSRRRPSRLLREKILKQ